jgi:microcystin-dependent protein
MPGIARHTPTLENSKAVRLIVADTALLLHVGEAITALVDPGEWYEDGSTVEDVVAAAWEIVNSWYGGHMIGQISAFVGSAPPGWLAFDGSSHPTADYPELSAVVPASWVAGGNFTLPDLQGVFLAGVGSAGVPGAMGGLASVALALAEMPAHTHTYTMPIMSADTVGVGAPLPVADQIAPGSPTGSAGSGQAHENRPPFIEFVYAVYAGRV